MILIEDLSKRFPGRSIPAIEGVNIELRDKEILGLVGLNGAGKTTTIRLAAGIALPTTGRILVDGHDIVHDKIRASEEVGWVPELFPFLPEAKARRLLLYFAGLHALTGDGAETRVREVLAQVGLAGSEDFRIRTYSQGMKRRFGLAAAMLGDPQNLLLDEILNGLDPEGMAFVRDWVLGLRQRGKGVLLSSHLLSELQTLADRVAFIHQGRLIRVVNRGELAQVGRATLHVTIENLDQGAVEYLETVGTLRLEENTALLTQQTADSATITTELVRRGYRVSEAWSENTSLEKYFLQLIHSSLTSEAVGQ